ncbi:hypothetical protein JCM10207_008270, partial [Rhodosporidiobolus poonsookiae]
MPPDRTHPPAEAGTASRFSDALLSGAPLSSVGPQHQPSLERGRACQTCRRRRVKCDGARPVCTRCAKSAKAHGEDPTSFACVYDAAPVGKKTMKEADRVAELAAEVSALRQQLAAQQAAEAAVASTSSAGRAPLIPPTSLFGLHVAFDPSQASMLPSPESRRPSGPVASTSEETIEQQQRLHSSGGASLHSFPSTTAPTSSGPQTPNSAALDAFLASAAAAAGPSSTTVDSGSSLADLAAAASEFTLPPYATENAPIPSYAAYNPLPSPLDLSWALLPSSYPPALPTPGLLSRLVDVFFQKSHLASNLISEQRFRPAFASLLAGGHANDAPLECLLHGICAAAALMVPEAFFESEPRYWTRATGDGAGRTGRDLGEGFSEWHSRKAGELLDPSFKAGRNLLQVAQASVLCTFCAYTSGRFTEIWFSSALSTRLATCLAINHLRPLSAYTSSSMAGQGPKARRLREPTLLPAPRTADELEERLCVFWAIFGGDRMTSAASDWPLSLDEGDISSLLPWSKEAGATSEDWIDDPKSSPLCIHNPSFFFSNPPHLVGPQQLYIKSHVLLGRVCQFLQRAPEPIGSGHATAPGEDLRESPAFRQLERTIQHFRKSIPRELQWTYLLQTTGQLDKSLLLVHNLSHVVEILLHEPFCLSPRITQDDSSFKKCFEAAKAIVTSVYELS